MNSTYINKLPDDLQEFVLLIEETTGLEIEIEIDASRAGRNKEEPDPLACVVNESEARLLLPAEDHFPEGSVLHELLHIKRFLVDGVPQITACEDRWTPQLESVFVQLDNNLEHLIIVPLELQQRPERRQRWITVLDRVLGTLQAKQVSGPDRDFLSIYTHLFAARVLQDSVLESKAVAALSTFGLMEHALLFEKAMMIAMESKESMVRLCVEQFSLNHDFICLDYFNPREGSCRHINLM